MEGQAFREVVERAFVPFLQGLGFDLASIHVSGRLYLADFVSANHAVVVSFEPGDDALFVILQQVTTDGRSDLDDRAASPRLSDLTARFMPAVPHARAHAATLEFERMATHDADERRLVAAAKSLSLVLPMYLEFQRKARGG